MGGGRRGGRGSRVRFGAAVALGLAMAGAGVLAANGGATGPARDPASAPIADPGVAGSDASVAGRVTVSPVIIRLELVPRKPKSKGPVEVRATVTNLSAVRVPQVVFSITANPDAVILRPAGSRTVRNLGAGQSTEATWSLCSTAGGMFQLVATVAAGSTTTDSQPISVSVPAGRC